MAANNVPKGSIMAGLTQGALDMAFIRKKRRRFDTN
jgi:hypothetical protein